MRLFGTSIALMSKFLHGIFTGGSGMDRMMLIIHFNWVTWIGNSTVSDFGGNIICRMVSSNMAFPLRERILKEGCKESFR